MRKIIEQDVIVKVVKQPQVCFPTYMSFDFEQTYQILLNLIDNALVFSKSSEIMIELRWVPKKQSFKQINTASETKTPWYTTSSRANSLVVRR